MPSLSYRIAGTVMAICAAAFVWCFLYEAFLAMWETKDAVWGWVKEHKAPTVMILTPFLFMISVMVRN